jgi:hypothetical protein
VIGVCLGKGANGRLELDLCASWVVHFWPGTGWRGCRDYGFCVGDSASDNYSVQSRLEGKFSAVLKPLTALALGCGGPIHVATVPAPGRA